MRQRMPQRKLLRQGAGKIFTSPANPGFCPDQRFPNLHGRVFWIIITVTTIVGIILSFIYAPRTWCSFCPMGSLSSWVTPRRGKLPEGYRRIFVGDRCTTRCKLCSAVCPMQLKPYESKNDTDGYLHPDCIKCGRCTAGCPLKVPEMKSGAI